MSLSRPPRGDGHVCVGVIEHGDQRAVARPAQPAQHQGLKVSGFKVNTDNLLCGDKSQTSNLMLRILYCTLLSGANHRKVDNVEIMIIL